MIDRGSAVADGTPGKRIYVLRHAKSSWKDQGLRDHDRPLARRGKRAAEAIARHIGEERIEPQLVLCSSARRARETLERIEPALGARTARVEPRMYGASAYGLLELLRGIDDTVDRVMLIGHNPGVHELVLGLCRPGPELRDVEAKLPTAALATLAFPGAHWADLDSGKAQLVAFVRPRELT